MELTDAIVEYRKATEEFLSVVSLLSESDLDVSKEHSWNARQVIHHVADSEAQSYARLRRLIAEPGTLIQGYDEAAWGENEMLGYRVRPVASSIAVFRAVRDSSAEVLERITTDQLANHGQHSESGEYSIATWLETYIRHPREHVEQIRSGLQTFS